jgi:DNA ligase-1
VLLDDVVSTSTAVAATRSRTQKCKSLAQLLRGKDSELLHIVVPWLAGEMRQGRIGVGYAAVSEALGTPPAEASSLSVREVDEALTQMGGLSGSGSAGRRKGALRELMGKATLAEQRFLGALLTGELRQGALDGVMAEAVASAAGVPAEAVRRAAMLSGNLVAAALAALEGGSEALGAFRLQVMRPIQPMLAQTAEDVEQALEALGRARFEAKLDGARVQVHRQGQQVAVWTRALLPVTDAVPEVVELVRALPVDEVVLDGEVIALMETGRPHPFQVTMRRFGRKIDIEGLRDELPLTPFFFDVLAVGGRSLLDEPLSERTRVLAEVVPEAHRLASLVTDVPEDAQRFMDQIVGMGHEGLMAKGLDTLYEAGNRGSGWLKLKPIWTLDLVVLAAEWGSGRRRGWLSNLHLGAREPHSGRFVMLGKTFKGLTDELLAWQTEELLAREVSRDGHIVHVRPELVVEIVFNEVQASPRYPGGVALRFARVKGYRPDKSPAEADTLQTVRAIFAGVADRSRPSGESP